MTLNVCVCESVRLCVRVCMCACGCVTGSVGEEEETTIAVRVRGPMHLASCTVWWACQSGGVSLPLVVYGDYIGSSVCKTPALMGSEMLSYCF